MTEGEHDRDLLAEVAAGIHRSLILQLRRRDSPGEVVELVSELVAEEAALLSEPARRELVERTMREVSGLGPLEPLLADTTVDEVMVNGHGTVYVERAGAVEMTGVRFRDEEELRHTIERILSPLGRRVDELNPMADARLEDGSRVNVVIPPLAVDGAAVSIRRFPGSRPDPERLVELGTLTSEQAGLLKAAIDERLSVIVSGGTGAGKTTLLNALASFIPDSERIVTIEDAAELNLAQEHVVRLESRSANVEGRGEVTIRDLLRNALRMRPDRIVIGEVRGPEALDLLTALNTGHDGVLSTVHANSADDALARLEVLSLMAGVGLPAGAIGDQLRRGIDLTVHIERLGDGTRRVREMIEVGG